MVRLVRVFLDFVIWAAADLQALAQRFLLLVRFRFAFDPLLVRFWFARERWFAMWFHFGSDLARFCAGVRKRDFGQD